MHVLGLTLLQSSAVARELISLPEGGGSLGAFILSTAIIAGSLFQAL